MAGPRRKVGTPPKLAHHLINLALASADGVNAVGERAAGSSAMFAIGNRVGRALAVDHQAFTNHG